MQNYFFIRDGKDLVRISFSKILYVEALNRYVRIVTCEQTYTAEGTLCDLESLLPEKEFCRIHKSYIISLAHVERFNSTLVTIGPSQIPIGKKYKDKLQGKIVVAFARY